MEMEDRIEVINSSDVNTAVSIVHECTNTCSLINKQARRVIETVKLQHDFKKLDVLL